MNPPRRAIFDPGISGQRLEPDRIALAVEMRTPEVIDVIDSAHPEIGNYANRIEQITADYFYTLRRRGSSFNSDKVQSEIFAQTARIRMVAEQLSQDGLIPNA